MSTPTAAPSGERTERVPLIWKIVSIGSFVLLVLGLLVVIWVMAVAKGALPKLDGSMQVAGVSAPVQVVRDAQGVPTMRAANRHDLLFAQGYVTAQDRLWQMDAMRRYASGAMSEILGARFVASDISQRVLLLRETAEHAVAALGEQDRSDLQAYSDGVNAYIDSHRANLPVEFRILRYSPAPWRPADSLVIGLHMSVLLTNFWPAEMQREKVTAKLGDPQLAADLYPDTSWRDRPPSAQAQDLEQKVNGDMDEDDDDDDDDRQRASIEDEGRPPSAGPATAQADASVGQLADQVAAWNAELTLPGSNNWVVSGAHTVSGKPLLSNDMHLPVQMPNLWYEAHLKGAGFDVAGVTLPGVPFVIVGHNDRIAWGFTNLGANVQDVFIETVNAKNQYKTAQGWVDLRGVTEIIKVKGAKDVKLVIPITLHGPIISELVPGEKRKLSLEWTIYTPKGVPGSLAALNTARNWQEFREALSHFPGPGQNVVYADVDGHIGYQAAGRVPIRKKGDGSVPVPGDTGEYDWTGFIPFDQMPSVYDPPSGILATANNRIVPKDYPYLVSTHWGSPYRAERIYKVLSSGKKFAPVDMLGLQMDIYSDFDHYMSDKLVYAVDHSAKASAQAHAAADILRSWDGRVTAEAAAPTIETAARLQLFKLLLQPKLGALYAEYESFMAAVALENILDRQLPRWLPKGYANYNELLVAALEAALTEGNVPRKLNTLAWGKKVTMTVEHPILGQISIVRRFAGPGTVAISGDSYTVKQTVPTLAPSQRMTVDFSDLDRSTLNIVTGQSGQIFSPHYEDQWKAWYEGTTFLLPFSDGAVAAAKKHELTLEPKK